jgi:thaumarchaeosortase
MFLDLMNYYTELKFPVFNPQNGNLPLIVIHTRTRDSGALVGWQCTGVQSLFLYTLIILLFFKRANISAFHNAVFFFIGLIGTFIVNAFRIISILLVQLYNGQIATEVFHKVYGELYFIAWLSIYIVIIVLIQRFKPSPTLNKTEVQFSY